MRRAIDEKNYKKAKKIFDANYAQVFTTLMRNPGQLDKRLKKDLRKEFAAPKQPLHFDGEVIELLSLRYIPPEYEYLDPDTKVFKIFAHHQPTRSETTVKIYMFAFFLTPVFWVICRGKEHILP